MAQYDPRYKELDDFIIAIESYDLFNGKTSPDLYGALFREAMYLRLNTDASAFPLKKYADLTIYDALKRGLITSAELRAKAAAAFTLLTARKPPRPKTRAAR